MGWGNASNVTQNNFDSGDDPNLARVELASALTELVAVINGRGSASGVAPLNASTKIDATYLPDTLVSSSGQHLVLQPNTTKVYIQDILNLQPLTVTEVEGITNAAAGDVVYVSNGNAGSPCLAVYTGTDESDGTPIFYKIALGVQISAT